jgi:hypothetical protein
MAERVGFEPTCRLLTDNPISSRARYDHFGTSPDLTLSCPEEDILECHSLRP